MSKDFWSKKKFCQKQCDNFLNEIEDERDVKVLYALEEHELVDHEDDGRTH